MKKRKFKWSWRRLLSFGLAVLLICGAVAGVSALVEVAEDDKKTISPVFKIGGLSDEGIATDNKGALFTPEAFKADGLEINLDFDSHLSYQVYYYTPDDEYVGCTEKFTKSGSPYLAPGLYARVVLYPIWGQLDDEDMEISWYEVFGYTSDVEIRVTKDGKAKLSGFEEVKLNSDVFSSSVGVYRPQGDLNNSAYQNFMSYTSENKGSNLVKSICFGQGESSTISLKSMPVALIVYRGDQVQYYYNGDELVSYPRAGNIPTKDNPLYLFENCKFTIVLDLEQVGLDDLNVFVYK